jgi:hypothetical protein
MALEDSPITRSEFESYKVQFNSDHPVAPLFNEANTERRRLFDETYRLLGDLPYNEVQRGNYVELQAYHHLWRESDIKGTAERRIFMSRRRNEEASGIAWHIFINDITVDDDRLVEYSEFVLPVGKRLLGYQVGDVFVDPFHVNSEDLGMCAMLLVSNNRCSILRGDDCLPLQVPQTWDIKKFYERYEVTDNLSWLIKVLGELKSCASSFEPYVTGDVE